MRCLYIGGPDKVGSTLCKNQLKYLEALRKLISEYGLTIMQGKDKLVQHTIV